MSRTPTVKLDSDQTMKRFADLGLTQTEVAAKAGVSASTVSKGFRGCRIGRLAARSIARVLKTPVDDLVQNAGNSVNAVAQ